jgi:hypothetical protein
MNPLRRFWARHKYQLLLLALLLAALAAVVGYYNRRIAGYNQQIEQLTKP